MKLSQLIKNEKSGEKFEYIDDTIFSVKMTVASTLQTLNFFQDNITIGEHLTNMEGQAGVINANEDFILMKLLCKIYNLDGASLFMDSAGTALKNPFNAIIAKATYKVMRSGNPLYSGNLLEIFEPVHKMNDGASTSLGVDAYQLAPSPGVKRFTVPLVFTAGKTVKIEFKLTTPAEGSGYTAANTAIMFLMQGFRKRPR